MTIVSKAEYRRDFYRPMTRGNAAVDAFGVSLFMATSDVPALSANRERLSDAFVFHW